MLPTFIRLFARNCISISPKRKKRLAGPGTHRAMAMAEHLPLAVKASSALMIPVSMATGASYRMLLLMPSSDPRNDHSKTPKNRWALS